ncbi:MAG: glucose/mannose transport system permease protein [Paracoccaceae bacterium]|jgi:glucose/mannose transport system permease protein
MLFVRGALKVSPLIRCDKDKVLVALLLAGLWQGTGLIMCQLLAGLRGIDEDIWSASRVDGIPVWNAYIFIVIR